MNQQTDKSSFTFILEISISSFLKVFWGVKNDLVKQENGVFVARSIKNGYGVSI